MEYKREKRLNKLAKIGYERHKNIRKQVNKLVDHLTNINFILDDIEKIEDIELRKEMTCIFSFLMLDERHKTIEDFKVATEIILNIKKGIDYNKEDI